MNDPNAIAIPKLGNIVKKIKWTSAFVSLLLVLYVVSYLVLLEPVRVNVPSIHAPDFKYPTYAFGGKTAEAIFVPANFLDKQIRPKFWVHEMPYSRPH